MFENRELPNPLSWKKMFGVGVVVMGLAIGTGELIMWPHLVTKYGLGLLWLAFLGISAQYFINQEVARHTLATGEGFFTSSARLFKWLAPFWFVSAILLYIWPGWASAIGTTLRELFGFGSYIAWAWASLGLILLLTLIGKVAYTMLELSLKIIVPTFFILIVVISFFNLSALNWIEAVKGLINFGGIPREIDLNVLLGAIVFAGAGGMLNLCVSLWYRDKQFGMSKYAGRIVNPITGNPEAISTTGYTFNMTEEYLKRWKAWMRHVRLDQGLIFWFFGFVTLFLLSLNAYAVLTPKGLVPEGLQVAVVQAHIFGEHWGLVGFKIFLAMAFLMLFSVMWTVMDAMTRILSDILYVNSRVGPFAKHFVWLKKISMSHLYYGIITIAVVVSAALLPFKQPLTLLTISAVLGGFTMAIYTPILIYLNNTKLPKPIRPGWFTNLMLGLSSIFYISFSIFILINYLMK